uniref:Uncharacterized protein n=1 Tax=Panagrolaimus davidi TaxID=227884 RepID=A0A914QYZ3_9BILA
MDSTQKIFVDMDSAKYYFNDKDSTPDYFADMDEEMVEPVKKVRKPRKKVEKIDETISKEQVPYQAETNVTQSKPKKKSNEAKGAQTNNYNSSFFEGT